uniref:Inactive serine protease 35 n=1 Tax=Amphiprion percula TaxID=161767 RepID=A0A3P8S9W5_AMPPE
HEMGLGCFIGVLFCAAALAVSAVCEANRWSRQELPELQVEHTSLLNPPQFRGQQQDEDSEGRETLCGIECQSSLPPVDLAEQERILGYETLHENGTRTHSDISLQGFNKTHLPAGRTRRKRQVYGADGRFVISDSHFVTNYPFSAAVRLSTGCSGVLVSPKHVLTSARCIHDGRDYLDSAQRLRVGVLRRAGRRKKKKEDGEEQPMNEGDEKNSIDGDVARKGGGRRRGRKSEKRDGGKSPNRIRRSAEPKKLPVFRWTRVTKLQIPQGWMHDKSPNVSPDYDYALLELRRPIKQKHMELGVAPLATPLARIHFSGFDGDKSLQDGSGNEKVVYRFCSVVKESDDLMYQHCDAQQGATGAGVYVRLKQDGGGGKGKWQRRVIGVFSGHRWVEVEGGELRDFNVAVRITPAKYAQICHWIRGDLSLCKEV